MRAANPIITITSNRGSLVSAAADPMRLHFGAFDLDESNARLLRDGRPIALAPRPFALLCALARQPGSLITKDTLLDAVWGHRFVSESVLKTAISELRMTLGDDSREPRYIETVSRRGYRFIGCALANTAVRAPEINGCPHALAQLRRAWQRVCAGARAIVWLSGDPGVGKTTLIDHFVSTLGQEETVRGQCVKQNGLGEPYLPILEALAELCRKDTSAAGLLRTFAPSWLLQLPWLGSVELRDALRRELAGTHPNRMLREIGEFFDRYTEQRPLLLVTEDIHWGDRATIELMDHVARRRGGGRLLWLASFRIAEVTADEHPFNSVRHELGGHGLCEEIALAPSNTAPAAQPASTKSFPIESGAADPAATAPTDERLNGDASTRRAADQYRQLRLISASAEVGT